MGAYILNGKNLADFGIVPGQAPGSNLAIEGVWNMPIRIGKVYHEWPDQDGVEPYLRADELFFAGRDLMFNGYVKGTDHNDAMAKVQALYEDIDVFGEPVPFSSEWGEWDVQVLQNVQIAYLGFKSGFLSLKLPFREPVADLSGVIPAATAAPIGIDGISFNDLGLIKMLTSDNFNRPQAKQSAFTAYGYEGHGITKRGLREFRIKFFIKKATYAEFQSSIQGLMALFSQPGARTLKLDDGTYREFFIKDGFTVIGVRSLADVTFGTIEIPFAEIRQMENWDLLTNNIGLILVDQYGKPLTEIIKSF